MNNGKNMKNGMRGSIADLITPFNEKGAVDCERLRRLIKRQINEGSDGILVLGETGEEETLTEQEREEAVRIAVEESNGSICVIAGIGSDTGEPALERSRRYEKIGADGLLATVPPYIKNNSSEMLKYFYGIADNVNIPVCIHNSSQETGLCLDTETAAKLSQHPNIVGIKEDGGSLSYVAGLTALITDDFNIYSGSDDITAALMSMGAAGTISIWANLMPAKAHEMAWAYMSGDTEKGRKIQLKYLKLINALFCGRNPVPVKEIMNMAGLKAGGCRIKTKGLSSAERRVLGVLYEEYREDIEGIDPGEKQNKGCPM